MYIRHFFNNKLLHINTVLLVLRCFEMGLYMVFLLSKYWLQYKNGRLHLFKFKFEMCMYTLFLLSKDWFKFTKNGRLYLSLDVLRCECICCFFLSIGWRIGCITPKKTKWPSSLFTCVYDALRCACTWCSSCQRIGCSTCRSTGTARGNECSPRVWWHCFDH